MEYKVYDDVVVCPLPDRCELDMEEIENIVTHTHNTWEHNRPISVIRENTIQGKRAELVIERLLEEHSTIRYISYDVFREDDFEKHAPFDGIIFNVSISELMLKEIVERVNNDVRNCNGDSGIITVETREFLENRGVFTVEIKSSLLQDPRDYKTMIHKHKNLRTDEDYAALCGYIKSFYDYFVYPHYCRDNPSIASFYDYTIYVRRMHPNLASGCSKKDFLFNLLQEEFNNACNVYTRVFFDILSDEIIIPGYVTKARFFEEPRIMKMRSPKSENAIYYMFHMCFGTSILEIDNDNELRRWNRLSAYGNLLGARLPRCSSCGNELKLVEATNNPDDKKHKFLYLCENCQPKRWSEMNQIHIRNMDAR